MLGDCGHLSSKKGGGTNFSYHAVFELFSCFFDHLKHLIFLFCFGFVGLFE